MAEQDMIFAESEELEVSNKAEFKGYTLSEIRYQRALYALKREYAREKALRGVNNLRRRSIFGRSKNSGLPSKLPGMLQKAVAGLSYADYFMLGISAFSTVRKALSLFKRKK